MPQVRSVIPTQLASLCSWVNAFPGTVIDSDLGSRRAQRDLTATTYTKISIDICLPISDQWSDLTSECILIPSLNLKQTLARIKLLLSVYQVEHEVKPLEIVQNGNFNRLKLIGLHNLILTELCTPIATANISARSREIKYCSTGYYMLRLQ